MKCRLHLLMTDADRTKFWERKALPDSALAERRLLHNLA